MQTKSPSLKRPQIYAVRGGNIWARVSDHVDLDFHGQIFYEKITYIWSMKFWNLKSTLRNPKYER